ncbi:hypothetical protein [Dictyobacter formicarum]|uniref:Bacterial Pleckstrin homology domain-containing protein n=1 Tax=Dictyobacter formicarum TaxID=2778368 RepID=A0ABQ3VPL2_9CHLR|nr:hypothetical protein [Dictyobacter formicarum]GHO88030.1 hypothetical protein KSZ_60360 [Dictyobacter formicarum]
MADLIRTRCKQGTLIITDNQIKIELGQLRQQTLARSALTGVDSSMGVPSVFGLGGGTNLVFHGQGAERLHADLVKPNVAREIVNLLGK